LSVHRDRILRLLVRAVGIAVLVLAISAQVAMAHAYLESSSPASGVREETAPPELTLRFDESLNRQLSTATLYDVQRNKRIAATLNISRSLEMVLLPASRLPRSSYRVEWHAVSGSDGHEAQGTFSFGVQAPAVGAATTTQNEPLDGLGWLRTLIRAAMYSALFVFSGALMLRTLLGARGRALWLLPSPVRTVLSDEQVTAVERSERQIAIDAGVLALALAAASALIETQIAAGSLSGAAIHGFLLANTTGLARVALVGLLALALSGAVMAPEAGGIGGVLALGALALSGHAESASSPALAVAVDWVHLIAGAIWLGGIAMLALVWVRRLRQVDGDIRRAVMGHLLPRFGRVALAAFLVVALSGAVNAYIQVRHPSLLWDSSYGRVLLVKSGLVGVVAILSYTHALWLRPRLLASQPSLDAKLERRHWRLIGAEPLVGVALAVAVALLVAFPTSGQVAAARAQAARLSVCNPCVLPLPGANQLAVAAYAGPDIVAGWLTRRGRQLQGQVRVLDINGQPTTTPFEIEGAQGVSPSCGAGCRTFLIRDAPAALTVAINPRRDEQVVTLAARWQTSGSSRARRLLERAQATMRALHSVSQSELVNSVPGVSALARYTLQAPDRLAWTATALHSGRRPQFEDAQIEIGNRQWSRLSSSPGWRRQPSHDTLAFSMPTWFTWTSNAEMVRLIGTQRAPHGEVSTVALMDPGAPAWWTLRIDVTSGRVLSALLITSGHAEENQFSQFNSAPWILAPTHPRA
jgi:copper transport protein